jgi:hypothetical protein
MSAHNSPSTGIYQQSGSASASPIIPQTGPADVITLDAKGLNLVADTSAPAPLMTGRGRLSKKEIKNRDLITIFLPTRDRVEGLCHFLNSLEATVAQKNLVDVWVYVDQDDQNTKEFIAQNPRSRWSFKVHFVLGPQVVALAQMHHALWEHADSNGGIFVCASDDTEYITAGWDNLVREVFNSQPDRLLLVYPDDPVTPDLATIPFLSAEWINKTGRFFTEYFPFWYEDCWLDEVAQMIGRRVRIDMKVHPRGGKGKTPRMRNVPFWQGFYLLTADERLYTARILRSLIMPEGSPNFVECELKAQRMMEGFVRKNTHPLEQLKNVEHMYGDPMKTVSSQSCCLYQLLESRAINHLWGKFYGCLSRKLFDKCFAILDTLKLATSTGVDVEYLRAIIYAEMGDFGSAKVALAPCLDREPSNPRSLALKAFLEQRA